MRRTGSHIPPIYLPIAMVAAVLLVGCHSVPNVSSQSAVPGAVVGSSDGTPPPARPSHVPPPAELWYEHPAAPARSPWMHLPFVSHDDHPAWWDVNPNPAPRRRAFVVNKGNAYYIAHPHNQASQTPFESEQAYLAYRNIQLMGRPY